MKKIICMLAIVILLGCGLTEKEASYIITDIKNERPITAIMTNTGDLTLTDITATCIVYVEGEYYQSSSGIAENMVLAPGESTKLIIPNEFGLKSLDDGYFTSKVIAHYNID